MNDSIDIRTLSQPTLARIVMLYEKASHDTTEQINCITSEFIALQKVNPETMRSVTTTIDAIHRCLSDDVLTLIAQDKFGSN